MDVHPLGATLGVWKKGYSERNIEGSGGGARGRANAFCPSRPGSNPGGRPGLNLGLFEMSSIYSPGIFLFNKVR